MAIVIGDSHAANIVKALQELHPGVNVLQATAVGCKPVLGTSGPTYCSALMQRMLVDWLPAEGNSVKNVIIAARWIDADIESLKRTVAHLEKMGKRVIIYGPNPEYSMALPLLLAYGELFKFDFSQRMIVKDRFRLDSILKTTFDDSAIYFSPIAEMCSQGQCRTDEGGTPMMSDGDHFTKAGAMRALRGFPLP